MIWASQSNGRQRVMPLANSEYEAECYRLTLSNGASLSFSVSQAQAARPSFCHIRIAQAEAKRTSMIAGVKKDSVQASPQHLRREGASVKQEAASSGGGVVRLWSSQSRISRNMPGICSSYKGIMVLSDVSKVYKQGPQRVVKKRVE